jgi:hypothetical protein
MWYISCNIHSLMYCSWLPMKIQHLSINHNIKCWSYPEKKGSWTNASCYSRKYACHMYRYTIEILKLDFYLSNEA